MCDFAVRYPWQGCGGACQKQAEDPYTWKAWLAGHCLIAGCRCHTSSLASATSERGTFFRLPDADTFAHVGSYKRAKTAIRLPGRSAGTAGKALNPRKAWPCRTSSHLTL